MVYSATEKFYVKNLDCAACAAKIERGLNRLPDVGEATLDFANLLLFVETDNIKHIIEEVGRIEPEVELIPEKSNLPAEHRHVHSLEDISPNGVIFLLLAGLLFGSLLLFEDWMHGRSYVSFELAIVATAYLLAGWNVLIGAFRTIRNGDIFDENVLMVIATTGAIAIHAYSEAVGVMIFYKVGEILQEMAVSRSRRAITSLLAARPDKAFLKTPAGFSEVSPESVEVGDEILVKPGEKVPLDGVIIDGKSQLDTSAITGEFKPKPASVGDAVLAGQINKTGALNIRVSKPFIESSIAKMMDLVENASARKARTEKFITTFARYYTPVVVLIAAGVAVLPPLALGQPFHTWIYRALVLLVISCPCALVVSIPLGYFGGIGLASRKGILVKGSNFIDALADLKTVVFDKTGTLTRGVFKVEKAVGLNGHTRDQLMEYAAAAEYHSNHPIATSIFESFSRSGQPLDISLISDHSECTGEGVRTRYKGQNVMVGSDSFMHRERVRHDRCNFETTVVHVAVNRRYAGYILIGDEIKPDARSAIDALRRTGVEKMAMLTGDNRSAAESVARRLNIDEFHADLLPEKKVDLFDQIRRNRQQLGKTAFVGDGINDAPVIARADVGVAMGGVGSDAAIETADVVLMTDSPSKVAEAVSIAKNTRRIVWQNIVLAFTIKGIFIAFGALGMASMWEAVFADMGTAVMAVFNATRILKS